MIQLWKCKWRVLVIWKFTWFTYMQAVLICVPFACHVFGLKCAESSCRKLVICIGITYCIFNCSKRLIRRFGDKELLRIVFHHCRNCLSLWFLWMKFHEWTRLFYYIIKGSPFTAAHEFGKDSVCERNSYQDNGITHRTPSFASPSSAQTLFILQYAPDCI